MADSEAVRYNAKRASEVVQWQKSKGLNPVLRNLTQKQDLRLCNLIT